MKISTQTDHLARLFGEEEAIRILAEVGFDAYDFSMFDTESDEYLLNRRDYEKEALKIKAYIRGKQHRMQPIPRPFQLIYKTIRNTTTAFLHFLFVLLK